MKIHLPLLVFALLWVRPGYADIKSEIDSIDKAMLHACQVAQINAARARGSHTETFLRLLSNLEQQYKRAGNRDALLACLKARAKYDPSVKKFQQATIIPDKLRVLVFGLEKQLSEIERKLNKDLVEAKSERARKLMAIQRGLVKRGEKEDARLVFNALKSPPSIPKFDATMAQTRTIVPKNVIFLTYDRPTKRWKQMDSKEGKGVKRTGSTKTKTLHYKEGKHGLLKVLWPDVLEIGDRFSVEVKGALSVELVDLDGADANARTSIPKPDAFTTFEISYQKDRITFSCDGNVQKTFYASGKLRGDDARNALLATSLRAGFAVKKGDQASFRNAKILRLK